ncbi:MAG: GNAT family N-acetyltransferase [Dehalococcoidales bacterium]|nr:GNAT family N-acetyltransferase [Dehalococcoidales bacterium]
MEETIVKELVIRDATKADLPSILVFRERLGESGFFNRTSAYYDWKYFQNPIGPTRLSLAEHNGQIISTFGLATARMKIGEQVIKCFQGMDSFTLPSHRGKGVHSKIRGKLLAEADRDGVDLIYSVPSAMLAPAMARFGAVALFGIKRFYYILNMDNFLKGTVKNELAFYSIRFFARAGARIAFRDVNQPVLDGLDITEISRFDDDVVDLWERVSKDYDAIILRDKEYLNWRYVASPVKFTIYAAHKKDHLLGYIVITLGEEIRDNVRMGYIVDMLTDPEEEGIDRTLMAFAFAFFKKQKADVIETYSMQNEPATKDNFPHLLRRLGFIPSRSTSYINIRTRLNLPPNCRYFFRFGDLDHV